MLCGSPLPSYLVSPIRVLNIKYKKYTTIKQLVIAREWLKAVAFASEYGSYRCILKTWHNSLSAIRFYRVYYVVALIGV